MLLFSMNCCPKTTLSFLCPTVSDKDELVNDNDDDVATVTLPSSPLPGSQTPEVNRRFYAESPSDTKELLEEDNVQTPQELVRVERARSRGMSLLMEARKEIHDEPKTGKLFGFLQILTASFGAFAHGGNDVRCVKTELKQLLVG